VYSFLLLLFGISFTLPATRNPSKLTLPRKGAGGGAKQGQGKPQQGAGQGPAREGDAESRRARLKAIQIDPEILEEIKKRRLCSPGKRGPGAKGRGGGPKASSRGRGSKDAGRFKRTLPDSAKDQKGEFDAKFSLLARYANYGVLDDHVKNFLGRRGVTKIRFVLSAHIPEQIPVLDIPEVAFAGRSNVGKSSLLNALGLTTIVRSSNTPGLTQSLNFYRLREILSLVDLPGYGFAYASDQKIQNWAKLSESFYRTRSNLKKVFVVLDARHGTLDKDEEFLRSLSDMRNAEIQVVLNKADLVIKPEDLARQYQRVKELIDELPYANKEIHMVSSKTGAGISELVQELIDICYDAGTWKE